jgi:hypothetical protein
VIYTAILPRILDRHKVGNLLHDAYRRVVAAHVCTYRTEVVIREVVATAAVAYIVAKMRYALG